MEYEDCSYLLDTATKPCVYLLYHGEVLQYVGMTDHLCHRVQAHIGRFEIDKVLVRACNSRGEALALEAELIASLQPLRNICGKDATPIAEVGNLDTLRDLVQKHIAPMDQRPIRRSQPRLERHWRIRRRQALGG